MGQPYGVAVAGPAHRTLERLPLEQRLSSARVQLPIRLPARGRPGGAHGLRPDAGRRDERWALVDAARLVEQQPGLLHLRTLQAVEAGGATVALGTDGGFAAARAAQG